jgi:hypothetical protein
MVTPIVVDVRAKNRVCGSTPNQVFFCDETTTTETTLPRYARHIRGFLRNSTATAALLDEIKKRDDLLEQVRLAMPAAIRSHCKQASIRDGQLTLSVDSPAWVARLKLHSPQLLDALADALADTPLAETPLAKPGDRITAGECRVRVLPEQPLIAKTNAAQSMPFYPNAARHLLQASECVASPELAESLKRLAGSLAAGKPPP